MTKEIKVPFLGDGIDKVTIAEWHYKPEDVVSQGEDFFELEADKALFNVPCEKKCILRTILVPAGQEASIGQAVAIVEDL
ncbi:MAG TPA: lipoyl domain-containing protein [Candidatus Omnitrophota bacterium]|nr:lipoyl domain-containing protein [Candidatus Omnitrophota bacterium]